MDKKPATQKGGIRYLASGLIFIVFVILVEQLLGWQQLLQPWLQLSTINLIIAVAVVLLSYWVRALRLFFYFYKIMRGSFLRCFKLVLQHNVLNNLLPMRTGELSFPVLMSRHFDIPMQKSLPALLWFRLLDAHFLFTVGIAIIAGQWSGPVTTIVSMVMLIPLPYLIYISKNHIQLTLTEKSTGKFRRLLARMLSELPQNTRSFWLTWIWTLINWITKLAVFAWVLKQFIDISPLTAWMGAIAGDVTSVLPIHGLAGTGTYEAGVVAGLMPFGITASDALTAAVNLHIFILSTALVSGGISLLFTYKQAHG